MRSVKNSFAMVRTSLAALLWMGDELARDEAFRAYRHRDLDAYIRFGAIPLLVTVYIVAGLHTWLYASQLSEADRLLWRAGTALVCIAATLPVAMVFFPFGRHHYEKIVPLFSGVILTKLAVMPQLITHADAATAESFFCVLAVLIIYLALRLSLQSIILVLFSTTFASSILILALAHQGADWGWYFYYFLAVSVVCVKTAHLQIVMERRAFQQSQVIAAQNSKLETMANQDALTGLANRRVFDQAIEQEWARHHRHHRSLAVLYMDIDYFKPYNDHYGHQQGDTCLAQVAQAITRSLLRSSDLAARYGGEEFVVLLPEIELAGAVEVANRIRDAVQNMAILHTASPQGVVTLSIGVAVETPTEGRAPRQLIAMADKALYSAKRSGRNGVRGAAWPPLPDQAGSVNY